jgi:mono/diheme cytochrome c family protein
MGQPKLNGAHEYNSFDALSGLTFLALSALAAEPDPAAVKRGKDRFIAACGFCHGNDGTGSRAPDLVRSPLLMHDTNGETIGSFIRKGERMMECLRSR